ncbi:MAG: putative sugar nucleotidyl transferase, partial [Bacteroidales bacterium]
MNYILFDDGLIRTQLLPFTFTRPIAEIRVGILTISEKWKILLGSSVSILTENYLSEKYPLVQKKQNVLINSSIIPDEKLVDAIKKLKSNQALSFEDSIIAYRIGGDEMNKMGEENVEAMEEIEYRDGFAQIQNVWDIFLLNGAQIRLDYERITAGRNSQKCSKTNRVSSADHIFIEEDCHIENAYLNADQGPIYIGKNVEIMEGAMLRGPLSIGEGSVIKMGAKIYGDTTFGPHCKIGGEVSNSVIFGYSNKAHDGYLGNAVIGEWCNLGADTNASNLKNDYTNVKVWSYTADTFVPTEEIFCGLFMGDYSKSAINTMFNTGSVVGVCANIFGSGFPRPFTPSFMWGTLPYDVEKAIETAERVCARRQI